MRLEKYLDLSNTDDDTRKFRSLDVGLVYKKAKYDELVNKMLESYNIDSDIIKTIKSFNKDFKREYNGKFQLWFKLDEKEKKIDKILKNSKKREILKMKIFEIKSELCKTKNIIESKMGENE